VIKTTSSKQARNRRLKKVALWTGVSLVGYELFVALVLRRQQRRDVFNAAVAAVNRTQKSLIVVGSPDRNLINTLVGRDYDCGDLCIDERGCPKCAVQAVGDLLTVLPMLPSNSAVIFVADRLEYVDNMPAVLAELQRVSGGDLFIVRVEPWTLTAFLYPGAKRRIFKAPPSADYVSWKALPWRTADKVASFKVLATAGKPNALPKFGP
jgi:hypothetical protein